MDVKKGNEMQENLRTIFSKEKNKKEDCMREFTGARRHARKDFFLLFRLLLLTTEVKREREKEYICMYI